MRSRDWLLIPLTFAVGVAGLIWGGRNAYVSLHNRSPLQLTCAQYEANPPDMQWVRLTDCEPDLNHLGVESRTPGGTVDEIVTVVYIPLRAPGRVLAPPAKILLAVDHGPLLAFGKRHPSDAESQAAWDVFTHPLPGLIELGVDRSERKKTALRELNLRVENDFAVLAFGDKPRPIWLSLGVLGVGCAAFALLVRRYRRRKRHVDLARATLVNEGEEPDDEDEDEDEDEGEQLRK